MYLTIGGVISEWSSERKRLDPDSEYGSDELSRVRNLTHNAAYRNRCRSEAIAAAELIDKGGSAPAEVQPLLAKLAEVPSVFRSVIEWTQYIAVSWYFNRGGYWRSHGDRPDGVSLNDEKDVWNALRFEPIKTQPWDIAFPIHAAEMADEASSAAASQGQMEAATSSNHARLDSECATTPLAALERCEGQLLHLPDWSIIYVGGHPYHLSSEARRDVLKLLVEKWERGERAVRKEELIAAADTERTDLRDVFRSGNETAEVWQTVVVTARHEDGRSRRGWYTLNLTYPGPVSRTSLNRDTGP